MTKHGYAWLGDDINIIETSEFDLLWSIFLVLTHSSHFDLNIVAMHFYYQILLWTHALGGICYNLIYPYELVAGTLILLTLMHNFSSLFVLFCNRNTG